MLDPKSPAGVLLREIGNVDAAIRYAERMAQRYADSRSTIAFEYVDAAKQLREYKATRIDSEGEAK